VGDQDGGSLLPTRLLSSSKQVNAGGHHLAFIPHALQDIGEAVSPYGRGNKAKIGKRSNPYYRSLQVIRMGAFVNMGKKIQLRTI